MVVLSLFDGMSSGQIALNRIGITPAVYYASELDRHAIKVTQANYPETIQLGDVTEWREWDIDWSSIDLLIGGSPCQGFSFAGKQLAFDDPRSKLFFVYVDILNHIRERNPSVKFMLENVKMKKEHLDVISDTLGVEPVFINSSVCSPVSRPRYYWANWDIVQPKESSASFLEAMQDDLVKMSQSWHTWWSKNKDFQTSKGYSKVLAGDDKGICMTARQYASWNGNFIKIGDSYYKPGKRSLAALCGAPHEYLDSASQRQAEVMTGNGWTVDVIAHIFNCM